jgi:DNA invertase Pin-like site-specific DNA recombinase
MPAKRELTMRQIRQMLRLARDGVSAREIGRTLGVARSTIQDNLKRASAAGLASMGRLTLNVLLSFAQFEREVTSERIRDKIAASKRKGLWVGGNLPLGYEMRDGKIAIVEEEAELVRSIFRRYLELGSVNELLRDLRERSIRTKTRRLSTGATRGGIPFGRGALYYLLSNHFYIGEVKYKNEILPGEQPPIMDRALFDCGAGSQNCYLFGSTGAGLLIKLPSSRNCSFIFSICSFRWF